MANKQPSKNDKKHRKLTKSPQVSCDMSMLSSSPVHSGFSISSFPSPKYIAYPSSLPNHYNDESLKKNFEYSRTDLSLTSPEDLSSTAIPFTPTTAYTTIPSPKRNDEPSKFQRYTNLSVKNPEQHRTTAEHHKPVNERDSSINTRVQHQQYEQPMDQQTNFLYLTNQMTIPTCCLKNSQLSSTTSNDGMKTSPSSSTVFNDHLRQLKQLFQLSNSSSQIVNKNPLNSFGTDNSCIATINNQKAPFSTTAKEHLTNENINHTNPFIFGNIFKSSGNDKSTTTTTTTTQAGNPGQTSSSISTSNTNPFLSENIKRDEFLKATMKVTFYIHILAVHF